MKELLLSIITPVFILCAVPVFVILFTAILRTLKEMPLFSPGTTVIAALCISLLCLIGLHQFLLSEEGSKAVSGHSSENNSKNRIEIILLPYAALALAIILCLLLHGISRIFHYGRQDKYPSSETPVIKPERRQITDEKKHIRK